MTRLDEFSSSVTTFGTLPVGKIQTVKRLFTVVTVISKRLGNFSQVSTFLAEQSSHTECYRVGRNVGRRYIGHDKTAASPKT